MTRGRKQDAARSATDARAAVPVRAVTDAQITAAFHARQASKSVCQLCEKEFKSTRNTQRFCGDKCRKLHWRLKREIEEKEVGPDSLPLNQ